MKKVLTLTLVIALCFTLVSCTKDKALEPTEDLVNPITLTMSITNTVEDDSIGEDFAPVKNVSFIVEEDTTALEATQIYCVSNDLAIEVDPGNTYVSSIMNLGEKDAEPTTGWIFKLNGVSGSLGANEEVLKDGDEISWEFVDFATYSW